MAISPSSNVRLRLVAAATLAAACLAGAVFAAPTLATTTNATCGNLQAALDSAASGDTIVLDPGQVCTQANSDGPGLPFVLPTHAITLTGGAGATIQGDGAHRLIIGTSVNATTISNLALTDGHGTSGGAIGITGDSSPTLTGLTVTGSSATGNGGGVSIDLSSNTDTVTVTNCVFSGDTAANGGGGLNTGGGGTVTITGSTFQNDAAAGGGGIAADTALATNLSSDVFQGDTGTNQGGGVQLGGLAAHWTATLSQNAFSSNTVTAPGASEAEGGGLWVHGDDETSQLIQTGNTFTGNELDGTMATELYGAGEYLNSVSLSGSHDRYTGNTITQSTADNEGAGIWIRGCDPTPGTLDQETLVDDVIAGNTTVGAAEGAGVYLGCGPNPTQTSFIDTTISGNASGGAGTGGVWGDSIDTITLQNTIVAGNTGADITGFATLTADHSDACVGQLPATGAGNICQAPALVAATTGDVHETAASPTIDAGTNADIPSGIGTDFEGDTRILGASVDIGADEYVPPTPAPTPVPTPQPQPAPAIPPTLSALKATHTRFVLGSGKPKSGTGTTLSFRLDQAATVTLTFERQLPGVRRGRRCVAAGRGKKCTRTVVAGTLVTQGKAGLDHLLFAGKLRHGRLTPGTYLVSIVAVDASGRSVARTLRLVAVAPKVVAKHHR